MDLTYDCTFKYLMKSPKIRFFLWELVSEVILEDRKWVRDNLVIEDSELIDSFFKHEKRKVTDVLVRCGNYYSKY